MDNITISPPGPLYVAPASEIAFELHLLVDHQEVGECLVLLALS